MAKVEEMTVPLVVRFADGSEKVAAHCFPHPLGLLYLDLFWNLRTPDESAHIINGTLQGEGPWKIVDEADATVASVRVLGCQNTDPDLHQTYQPWKAWLESNPEQYPGQDQIAGIALKLGATLTKQ
jgi:hypothetical protein